MTHPVLLAADRIEQLGWVQNVCAVDEKGAEVSVGAPEAVAWCACGAINLESGNGGYDQAIQDLGGETVEDALINYNDEPGRTASEVAAFMRELLDQNEVEAK